MGNSQDLDEYFREPGQIYAEIKAVNKRLSLYYLIVPETVLLFMSSSTRCSVCASTETVCEVIFSWVVPALRGSVTVDGAVLQ